MTNLLRKFVSEDGAASVEYALLASLVALVIIVAVKTIGQEVSDMFGVAASSLGG